MLSSREQAYKRNKIVLWLKMQQGVMTPSTAHTKPARTVARPLPTAPSHHNGHAYTAPAMSQHAHDKLARLASTKRKP